jgi:hypothetical protein
MFIIIITIIIIIIILLATSFGLKRPSLGSHLQKLEILVQKNGNIMGSHLHSLVDFAFITSR